MSGENRAEAWRSHLRPNGKVGFSEVVWREPPSPKAKVLWREAYPKMDALIAET